MQQARRAAFSLTMLGVGFYGCARVLANPYEIVLVDRGDIKHQYQLQEGIFWDSAKIIQTNTADSKQSEWTVKSIRNMVIKHRQ